MKRLPTHTLPQRARSLHADGDFNSDSAVTSRKKTRLIPRITNDRNRRPRPTKREKYHLGEFAFFRPPNHQERLPSMATDEARAFGKIPKIQILHGTVQSTLPLLPCQCSILTSFVRRLQVQELRDHDAHVGEEADECERMHGHDQRQNGCRTNGEGFTLYPGRSSPILYHAACSLDWPVLANTLKRQKT